MPEHLKPINSQRLPSGRIREWYAGRLNSRLFPEAVEITLIQGLTGEETQVDYPFSVPPVAVINVVAETEPELEYQPSESAAD